MSGTDPRSVAAESTTDPVRVAHGAYDAPDVVDRLGRDLGTEPLALVALFVTPSADFERIVSEAARVFGDTPVIACSTAGEISTEGYTEDELVAVGFSADCFAVETLVVDSLAQIDAQSLIDQTIRTRSALARSASTWPHEFAFLMVDGLSLKEDELTFALATGLGPVPLFGGSAGDGTRFEGTYIAVNGTVYQDAASVTLVRSRCPVKVFSSDHLVPTNRQMVVTEADPKNRIVRRLNAEPAAREYARILGKDPEQLSAFTFAAHPVVVTIGGNHHVRSIQRVTEQGELVFFSAIDEGLVLTLAEPADIVEHTRSALRGLGDPTEPSAILACDCILRRLEAGQKQKITELSNTLAANNVIGFSTYGEQLNAMHVNQTMTGVAIYPPAPDLDTGAPDDQVARRPE